MSIFTRQQILMAPDGDGSGGGAGGGAPLFETLIPAEFKEAGYLSDLKSLPVGPEAYNALFKKLDGAEKLIGKKTAIPEPNAPEAEWNSFFARLRPETPDAYDFKDASGADPKSDPEFLKGVKSIFHEAGVNKVQAKKIYSKFEEMMSKQSAAQVAEQERLDAEFLRISTETFGAENEKKLEKARTLLNEFTPANLKPHLEKLSNEGMVILAGVMNAMSEKFMKPDNMNPGGGSGAGKDGLSMREEAKKIMASQEYSDCTHPGHAAAVKRVNDIYNTPGVVAPAGN